MGYLQCYRQTSQDNYQNKSTKLALMKNSFKVNPVNVDSSAKYQLGQSYYSDFIVGAIIVEIIAIIVALYSGGGTFWLLVLAVIIGYYLINKAMFDSENEKHTKAVIAGQIQKANSEAEFYTQKFNNILAKSEEIVHQILPYCEESTKQSLERAKIEFSENVYSPFWSEIEEASKILACYIEAVNQLCLNSEVYTYTLKNLSHNFPMPFPFATNISISQTVMNEYKAIIRTAQTNPTFSIIWEQRRNSTILIGGFRTLENAINNMSNEISSALSDLKYSITSELSEMKYVQKEQLKSFETSQVYLNQTLNSMDNKLYYIQWKEKPLGKFYPR